MKELSEIPTASIECWDEPEVENSGPVRLAQRLEAEGHHAISVGRAIVAIERTEAATEVPPEVKREELLKLSIYPDPDVAGNETPLCVYVETGRFGFQDAFLQVFAPDGRERIFKLEPAMLRDDF